MPRGKSLAAILPGGHPLADQLDGFIDGRGLAQVYALDDNVCRIAHQRESQIRGVALLIRGVTMLPPLRCRIADIGQNQSTRQLGANGGQFQPATPCSR